MDAVDAALCRAWALSSGDWWDAVEDEIGTLLPALVDAGFVTTYGHSPSGFLWRFTPQGRARVHELGCDD